MKDELTPGESVVLNDAINRVRANVWNLTPRSNAAYDWYLDFKNNDPGLTPPLDQVCATLRAIQLQNKDKFPTAENNALRIQLKLGCRGGMSLRPINRFLITKAVDAIVDPGVPVALDYWLEPSNRQDLIDVLEEYLKHGPPSEHLYDDDMRKLIQKFRSMSPIAASKPKTEHERMRDFFFPKRRGSFFGLKSWK